MPDRNRSNLPFESDNPDEAQLWTALVDLPADAPSPGLRRGFYRALDRAGGETWLDRLHGWLGFGSNAGWATAMACGVIGFGLAGGFSNGDDMHQERLAVLEESVAFLNRELILDRLGDANAGTRLKGVFDARDAAASDAQILRALLSIAASDRVASIRTAAIDALGPGLATGGIANELTALLERADTPTVQLALIDLILRYGSGEQLELLLEMAASGVLHPDLQRHVVNSLGGDSV